MYKLTNSLTINSPIGNHINQFFYTIGGDFGHKINYVLRHKRYVLRTQKLNIFNFITNKELMSSMPKIFFLDFKLMIPALVSS